MSQPLKAEAKAGQAAVAWRAGQPVSAAQWRRDVAALAALLPASPCLLNLCTDRYRFLTGLAAALTRGQLTLLPAAPVPAVLAGLAADHPGLTALTDGTAPNLPSLSYPEPLPAPVHAHLRAPDPLAIPDDQAAVKLFTSGSTGRPQPILKNWGTLRRSALAAGKRLNLAALPGATIIGTVPHHHSYGLESVILLGLLHGIAISSAWPLYPADIRAALTAAAGPRILVTSPVHLRALLAEPDGLPRIDLILSATAPLSQELAQAAEQKSGGTLIEIYGCTEAGQIATRRTASAQDWQCLDGVELHQDAQGSWVSGPSVAGPTLLQDHIELTGPGTFRLGARAADMVDVAGKRGSLAYLTQQLLAIEGVEDGVFFMGEAQDARVPRLAALAVAPALTPRAVLAALRQRIDAAFLPRPLLLLPALPRNALGKLPRETLLGLIAGQPQEDEWHEQPLSFAADHPTAEGHFPGNPILPGALLLDAAIAAIAGDAPHLTARGVKFLRPVAPGTALRLRWQETAPARWRFECLADGALVMSGTLAREGTP